MLKNWENWCRLCANIDSDDVDLGCKKESIDDQLEIVNKHLMLSLLPFGGCKLGICSDCRSFVEKLDDFKDRCLRADKMFEELRKDNANDLALIRCKHGFDIDGIPKVQKEESLGEENLFNPVCSDPLESKFEIAVEKMEVCVVKKRGRPRKIKRNTDKRTAVQSEVKKELVEALGDVCSAVKKRRRAKQKKENICDFCSRKFLSPCLLRDHIWSKHRQEERPYVCSECGKRFTTKGNLQSHMTIHMPDEMRLIFPCPYCEKKFSQKICVEGHITACHDRDNAFICEECGKSCNTKGALGQHMETHIKEYNFQCQICSKKFKTRLQVKRHEVCHSAEVFLCGECGLKLKSKKTLRMHKLVHLDVKKFKCNYCGNEFKRSKTLKNHLLLHSGLRPYECQFCDKTFTFGSSFRVHQKKVHPAELAALEASGEAAKITKLPRLEQLQPKHPMMVNTSAV
ncbi:oocyte zinc finger protein XlCOF6-like [Phlebotomus argentipes]|uniref:oocyte zinc finger protein XlCOF6-like n=1 Tax=Phlebotomus argentipes TaxID=94469 RepID=UPI002892F452|nr:oocyte zinc finger protein XlCOF6-like [Phlebotomus argentipes]